MGCGCNPIAGEDTYPIGARSLRLRRLPSQNTIGAHRQPHRTIDQPISDHLPKSVRIGRLESQPQRRAFGDPAGAHISPDRRAVQTGSDTETHRSGRWQSDPQVPVLIQRGLIATFQNRDGFRLGARSDIGKGNHRQRQRLAGADLQVGFTGQLIQVEVNPAHLARIPVDELEVHRTIGGLSLKPDIGIQRLKDGILPTIIGRNQIIGGHTRDPEIPASALQGHRQRIGGDEDVLVTQARLVALVLEVGNRGHRQAVA